MPLACALPAEESSSPPQRFSILQSHSSPAVISKVLIACANTEPHIIGQLLDPSRESPGVSLEAALGVPIVGGPAVVQAHILVSSLLPALLHHHVCHLHVQLLTARARRGDRQVRTVKAVRSLYLSQH